MKVNAIYCKNSDCNQVIISRSRHDFRTCKCGNASIDGGFSYVKISVKEHPFEILNLDIDKTKNEIINDYNKNGDFGIFDYNDIKDKIIKEVN